MFPLSNQTTIPSKHGSGRPTQNADYTTTNTTQKIIPFVSNFTSNPFLNFLVNVIDKAENKYIKIQIKDKSRNRKENPCGLFAVKTAKNGRSGGSLLKKRLIIVFSKR